jgi:hypothetical protein
VAEQDHIYTEEENLVSSRQHTQRPLVKSQAGYDDDGLLTDSESESDSEYDGTS